MGQFLDKTGLTLVWSKIKDLLKTNVTDKLGANNGIATLGSDGKLTSSQVPSMKTVNGQSILGSGNIAIDLTIYKLVEKLPDTGEAEKIYLVLTNGGGGTQDKYTEYVWINNAWEKFGEYKADVDLSTYLKTDNLDTEVGKLNYVKDTDYATAAKGGVIKIGFTRTGKKFPVALDNNQAYVEVPYIDNVADESNNGLMSSTDKGKLDNITANATADSAIPTQDLEALLV